MGTLEKALGACKAREKNLRHNLEFILWKNCQVVFFKIVLEEILQNQLTCKTDKIYLKQDKREDKAIKIGF